MAEKRIRWTDEEWNKLIELVWSARKKNAVESLSECIRMAYAQFPQERRRQIQQVLLKDVGKALTKKQQEIAGDAEELSRMKMRLTDIQTREEVIGSLTEYELSTLKSNVLNRLSPAERVEGIPVDVLLDCVPIADLTAFAGKRLIEEILSLKRSTQQVVVPAHQHSTVQTPVREIDRRPKITVVGPRAEQIQRVKDELSSDFILSFICNDHNKGITSTPEHQDGYILQTKFISHTHTERVQAQIKKTGGKLVFHSGGLTELISLIRNTFSN